MQREREDELRSQADSLAIQMATIHHQKAERRTKVLETSRAMLSLHSLLIQLLRMRKSLEKQDMALSIQNHCLVIIYSTLQTIEMAFIKNVFLAVAKLQKLLVLSLNNRNLFVKTKLI